MRSKQKVGYKSPPLHTRFRKGQSGNPRGRPRGAKNLKTELLEELGETLVVQEGSSRKRVTKKRALIKSLIAKGLKGDTAAIARLFELYARVQGLEAEAPELRQKLTAEEREVLEAMQSRLTQQLGLPLPKSNTARGSRRQQ